MIEYSSDARPGGMNLDVLQLGEGLTPAATQLSRGVNDRKRDLTLDFGGGDKVTLEDYFLDSMCLETIAFNDGTRWTYASVTDAMSHAIL